MMATRRGFRSRSGCGLPTCGVSWRDFTEKWEEDLLADVPGTVREGVRSRLADWTRRFGLSLPEGASTSLEAHIASLVQDSAKAISCTSGAG